MNGQRKHYGEYTLVACPKDAKPEEKLRAIKKGIDTLCKMLGSFEIVPDFNTVQIIVHEGMAQKANSTWQIDDSYPLSDYHAISVAIKFYGEEAWFLRGEKLG